MRPSTSPTFRPATLGALVALTTLVGLSAGLTPAAAADTVTVVIDAPTPDQVFPPGPVPVSGRLTGGGAGTVASVVYVADLSGSTASPTGNDCNGDGTVDAGDDQNGDLSVGDTLDCEIAGITALNGSLAAVTNSAARVRVGLIPFADTAPQAAAVTPALDTFVAPGQATDAAAGPDLLVATRSMVQGGIGQYTAFGVGGGTNFDDATTTALATLAAAPAGPKFVFFLSDGQATVAQTTLDGLTASGVDLRSFAIGGGASCDPAAALSQLAAATGETCTVVPDPSTLATDVLGSAPNGVEDLTVEVAGQSYPATLDVIGNWSITTAALPVGTYTATATATLTGGGTATATVHFVVAAPSSPPGTTPPGTTATPTYDPTAPNRPILAVTGASSGPPLVVGLVAVAAGIGFLLAGVRRRDGRSH